MATDRKKKRKEKGWKKKKENIICVHSNWVKFSAAKNGLGKSLLRDVRYVYWMPASCTEQTATSYTHTHTRGDTASSERIEQHLTKCKTLLL